MNRLSKARGLIVAALAAVAPLGAWAIDFNDLDPDIYNHLDSFEAGGYTITAFSPSGDAGGLSGAIVSSDGTFCVTLSCPIGNTSNYYVGLNDGGISVAGSGVTSLFQLSSFDASFLHPVAQTVLPESVSRIVLNGLVAATHTYTSISFDLFGSDANGYYSFSSFSVAGTALDGITLSALSINACLTTDFGSCLWPAGNQAQFALDNVAITAVPEPGTWALMAGGLFALAAAARRKSV